MSNVKIALYALGIASQDFPFPISRDFPDFFFSRFPGYCCLISREIGKLLCSKIKLNCQILNMSLIFCKVEELYVFGKIHDYLRAFNYKKETSI